MATPGNLLALPVEALLSAQKVWALVLTHATQSGPGAGSLVFGTIQTLSTAVTNEANFMTSYKTLAFIAFLGVFSTPDALADKQGLTLCNKSKENISVAFGFYGEGSWHTVGWHQIKKDHCHNMRIPPEGLSRNPIYLHAMGVNGSIWGKKYSLCVKKPQPFQIQGYKNCSARGYEEAKFTKVSIKPGIKHYTYSFIDNTPSKIDSLDIGESVYIQGWLSDELVTIVRIDKSSNKVKVLRSKDGTAKWVSVDEIITREESQLNDAGRIAIGAGILYCLFNPQQC